MSEAWTEIVVDRWLTALRDAWHVARGERLAELRGDRRIKGFDGAGLHVYSAAWGRVIACEGLIPELQEARLSDPSADPVSLRRMAHRDAQESFASELRNGGPAVFA